MSRRRSAYPASAAVAVVGLLSACGSPAATTAGRASGSPTTAASPTVPAPSGEPTSAGATGDAAAVDGSAVLGSWRRSGASGDTGVATFTRTGVSVTVPCARIEGSWRAVTAAPAALFTAVFDEASSSCPTVPPVDPSVPWISSAASFRTTAQGLDLLDASGRVTASLVSAPDASATPGAQSGVVVTAPVAELPDGVRPATAATLVGRWTALGEPRPFPTGGFKTPVGPSRPDGASGADGGVAGVGREPTGVSVRFSADGSWLTSGTCPGASGGWSLGADGRLVAVQSAVQPAVRCPSPAPRLDVADATRAGLIGSDLVLLASNGAVVGRFVPTS